MYSHKQKSRRVMNNYQTNSSLEDSYTNNNYTTSSDSSGSDIEETEDFKTPTLFQSTPLSNSRKKPKVVKKISCSTSHDNEISTKRIHVSSDEGDFSEKHIRKKARRNSENDGLPEFLRNLDITCEGNRRKKSSKRSQERYIEEKRIKKRSERSRVIDNGYQESSSYVAIAQPSIANGESESNVCVTKVPSLSAEIVVLQHPTTITLQKFVDVKVVNGGVSILGWKVTSHHPKVTVFSCEESGLIQISTLYSDTMWKSKEIYENIKATLKEYAKKESIVEILEKCDSSSVILILQRAALLPSLQIIGVYYPKNLWFKTDKKPNCNFLKICPHQMPIRLTAEHAVAAEAISLAMRKATLNSDFPSPRVVIFGDKQIGKSTTARFIINRLLETFSHIFYLDVDPGQPEFTPPGVVSLTKVDKCILGAPFTHPRKPVKMIFTGGITASSSPPMYFKSVKQLTEYYFKELSSETLLVNTMGWIQDIGLLCLKDVMAMVKPTIVIEVLKDDRESSFKNLEIPDNKVKHYIIPAAKNVKRNSRRSRDLSMLAYFGQCGRSLHLRPMNLNEMKTFCISWDKIAIYVFGSRIMPYRIVEAINASFVALCTVDESLILKSDVPEFQTTLKPEPDNICHGFGIVRAIDETQHLLHIITPLKLAELQKVNAIMKGRIVLPDAVYFEQNITEMPLPFLDLSEHAPPRLRKIVSKGRKFVPYAAND